MSVCGPVSNVCVSVYLCVSTCLCVCLSVRVWSVYDAVLDDEKASLQKELGEVRVSLREVEAARTEAHGHWQQLRRDLTAVETERNLLTDKLNDLHVSLTEADDALEELRTENLALKQKVGSAYFVLVLADLPINS